YQEPYNLGAMLKPGPGLLAPRALRGIVGYPSNHTLQALVLAWYARHRPRLRWAALALNGAVLLAVPIQGGHHLVDMLGGAGVTVLAILLAGRTVAWAGQPARAPAAIQPVLAPR